MSSERFWQIILALIIYALMVAYPDSAERYAMIVIVWLIYILPAWILVRAFEQIFADIWKELGHIYEDLSRPRGPWG